MDERTSTPWPSRKSGKLGRVGDSEMERFRTYGMKMAS